MNRYTLRHAFCLSPTINRRGAGFTLIEVMVVVAIIGILASIALPSYQQHVLHTHRSAAKACISQHAQFMERYYTTNMTYVGANPVLGCRAEGNLNTRYTIAVNVGGPRAYAITATAISTQLRDAECGNLTLDQAGAKGATGTDPGSCW